MDLGAKFNSAAEFSEVKKEIIERYRKHLLGLLNDKAVKWDQSGVKSQLLKLQEFETNPAKTYIGNSWDLLYSRAQKLADAIEPAENNSPDSEK